MEFFRTNYGPMSRAFASLDANGQEKLRNELVSLWSAHNKAADDTPRSTPNTSRSSRPGGSLARRQLKGNKTMYSNGNLKKLPKMGKLAPEAMTAFRAWDKAALADGAIPKKYKELMAIAVALTTQCPYCIEVHRQEALKAGVTEQELAEAGPCRGGSSCRRRYHPRHSSLPRLKRGKTPGGKLCPPGLRDSANAKSNPSIHTHTSL